MYRMDARWPNSRSTATKQREMEPYDDITCLLVGNNSTFRLLVGKASFASALIKFKYGRTVGQSPEDCCTLNPDIRASGNNCTTVHVKLQCRIRMNLYECVIEADWCN